MTTLVQFDRRRRSGVPQSTKVHLMLLPFWAPMTPPLGISVLKGHLQHHGVRVSCTDLNNNQALYGITNRYFQILRTAVPAERHSNFHMIAFDVLSSHLMANLNQAKASPAQYRRLVELLVETNYRTPIDEATYQALNAVVTEFFEVLEPMVLDVVREHRPTVFGVSTYSTSLAASLFALQIVRKHFPEIRTMMGGGVFADQLNPASPNWAPFVAATEPYLDNIVVGEGEEIFLDLLRGRGDGRVHSLKARGMKTLDLSTAVVPDFSDFESDDYLQMASFATRSCPFQCSFCSETVQWGKFRAKGPDQILRELVQIRDRHGGKVFLFGDSLLNQVATGLAEAVIDSGEQLFYDAYLRADPEACDADNAALWRRGGFYRARFGIESGSDNVLTAMNKKISSTQAASALRTISNAGIKTTTYWVVGHPGETDDDFLETMQFLRDNASSIYEADWHPFYFFPQGQVYSKKWDRTYGTQPKYPEEFAELLLTQIWTLKTQPTPEQVFDRMNLFRTTCQEAGIPNPYSLAEIMDADERWTRLHENAVPELADVMNVAL